jgi:thiamine-phosphate pyrophosphorylase
MKKQIITGGIYLVIDPSMLLEKLLSKLEIVLKAGISVVQIWDNWGNTSNKSAAIQVICSLCHAYQVPVFINNDWKLLQTMPLDGVHFDNIPAHYSMLRSQLKQDCLIGITCNNDLSVVKWADDNKLDYVSFCSMFPSSTSNSCDIVTFETVRQARALTGIPLFLAGGITLDNLSELKALDFDGVALISGIMSANEPAQSTKAYLQKLKKNEINNHK